LACTFGVGLFGEVEADALFGPLALLFEDEAVAAKTCSFSLRRLKHMNQKAARMPPLLQQPPCEYF